MKQVDDRKDAQDRSRLVADLLHLMRLERLEDNLFRGDSRDIGSNRVFGGQVLGQALSAASSTVEDRVVHSLHAYFLRAGNVDAPVVYDVDRARDGKSFTNRRVVAIQHGRPILNLAASFQHEEAGLEHQAAMPEVPPPEDLPDAREEYRKAVGNAPEHVRRFLTIKRPFEFRHVERQDLLRPQKTAPRQCAWFRTLAPVPADPELHRVLLAYVSDFNLVRTATLPHGVSFLQKNLQLASLDHAMWFHRGGRVDDWLLYAMDSPSAAGARGLARGQIFARDGTLIASTAQEGLIRLWPE